MAEQELLDYEEDVYLTEDNEVTNSNQVSLKGTYVSVHSSGFRDFLLKPEITRAIIDCGFEHPSEGQYRFNKKENYYIYYYSYVTFNTQIKLALYFLSFEFFFY